MLNIKDFEVVYHEITEDTKTINGFYELIGINTRKVPNTLAFKFKYKGIPYGVGICDTKEKPFTDKSFVLLLKNAIKSIEGLINKK